MEPGPHYLQLLMTVALILTAAVVAFICDMLKRNNEQLREMNIELQIRQEEEQKRSQRPPAAPAPNVAPPKERSIVPKEKKRTVNAGALAAMERGAALAGTGKRPPAPESKPEPAKQTSTRRDWGSLLSRNAKGIKVPPAPTSLPAEFQTGFHDGFVLKKLVESHQPITGLVVSIGVNASQESDGKLEAVSKLVESLIGPDDFAAQSGEDEFLLIYPRESGAAAQRRLSQIAQQLWDFQLRSPGSSEILFSWGGVEVQSESIEEAVASASDRMQETKRGRKLLTMGSPVAVERRKQIQRGV